MIDRVTVPPNGGTDRGSGLGWPNTSTAISTPTTVSVTEVRMLSTSSKPPNR